MRLLALIVAAGSALALAQAPSSTTPAPAAGQEQTAPAPTTEQPATQSTPEPPAAGAPASAPAIPYRRVGSMSELMIDIIYPTSNAIFYIGTRTPRTQVQWNELKGQALMLAEAANLLMMPGRSRDQDKWMADAKLMLDAGTAAVAAAKAKNLKALVALNDQLYMSCTQCHMDYRPNYRRGRGTPP